MATVFMPISLQVRITRMAISPRLAINIFLNMIECKYRSLSCDFHPPLPRITIHPPFLLTSQTHRNAEFFEFGKIGSRGISARPKKTRCLGGCLAANGRDDPTRLSISTQYQRKNLEQSFLDHIDILHFTSNFQKFPQRKSGPLDLF
jgi:hypothetical protein